MSSLKYIYSVGTNTNKIKANYIFFTFYLKQILDTLSEKFLVFVLSKNKQDFYGGLALSPAERYQSKH